MTSSFLNSRRGGKLPLTPSPCGRPCLRQESVRIRDMAKNYKVELKAKDILKNWYHRITTSDSNMILFCFCLLQTPAINVSDNTGTQLSWLLR